MSEREYSVRVDNMICPQCEDEIAAKLLFTRGVSDVRASYRKSRVTVRFDDAYLSEKAIDDALSGIGYPPGDGKAALRSDIFCALGAAALFFALPLLMNIAPMLAVPESAELLPLFVLGLVSGVHCIGMCGGPALAQTAGKKRKAAALGAVSYNLGRVAGYTLMGALFGLLGTAVRYSGAFRSMVLTLCGLAVVIAAVRMWGIVPALRRLPTLSELFAPRRVTKRRTARQPLVTGLLTALMPCGTMSSVWLLAAGSGSALRGAAAMLAFALGTVPALALFASLGTLLPKRWNKYLLKASTAILLALGLTLLRKGLTI